MVPSVMDPTELVSFTVVSPSDVALDCCSAELHSLRQVGRFDSGEGRAKASLPAKPGNIQGAVVMQNRQCVAIVKVWMLKLPEPTCVEDVTSGALKIAPGALATNASGPGVRVNCACVLFCANCIEKA